MSCKTVPQHVRRETHTQAGFAAVGGEDLPDAHPAQRTAAAIDEKSVRGNLFALADEFSPRFLEVALDESKCFLADRHDALFVAFANAPNAACRTVQIHNAKVNELRNTQARG